MHRRNVKLWRSEIDLYFSRFPRKLIPLLYFHCKIWQGIHETCKLPYQNKNNKVRNCSSVRWIEKRKGAPTFKCLIYLFKNPGHLTVSGLLAFLGNTYTSETDKYKHKHIYTCTKTRRCAYIRIDAQKYTNTCAHVHVHTRTSMPYTIFLCLRIST